MSEEKKAIKYLEFLSNEKCECEACQRAKKEYKTILNLIEKQQKEIEEKNIAINKMSKDISRQLKEIEELKNNELDYTTIYINGIFEGKKYYKDKIRERIKEARKIRWHIPKLVIEYFEELLEENIKEENS